MANPFNVSLLVIKKLEQLGFSASSTDTHADHVAANWIVDILVNLADSEECYVQVSESLDVCESELEGTDGHDCDQIEPNISNPEDSSEETSSECEPNKPKRICRSDVSTEYKKKAVEYWLNKSGNQTRSLSAVTNRFRRVKYLKQLHRWKEQLEKRGPAKSEFKVTLNDKLFDRFLLAREQNISVHDSDLKDWALQIARDVGRHDCKASQSWITDFKKEHRLRSRKITKFITRNYTQDRSVILGRIEDFLGQVRPKIKYYNSSAIYNADQSGFEKEMRSKRTLDLQGVKHVEAIAQSVNSLTHSYTIMPVISMDGMLFPTLYICLQEAGGSFGPRVVESMFKARNLIIDASTSGKMTKKNLETFYRDAFFPNAKPSSLLLVDSWTAYSDPSVLNRVKPEDKNVEIAQIPPGTTGQIQPLDKEFFRQWKAFYRQLTEKIISDCDISFDVFKRDSILKLQSFVHYQFSSLRFRNLICYAWYATRYTDVHPGRFQTPAEYCLLKTKQNCELLDCTNKSFVRCAWCQVNICFEHVVERSHFCDLYVA